MREGEMKQDHLYLVSFVWVDLHRDSKGVQISCGNFIGEISFLIDGPASADVVEPKGTEYIHWNRNKLKTMMNKSPRLSNVIGTLFNTDVARKLSMSWTVFDVIANRAD